MTARQRNQNTQDLEWYNVLIISSSLMALPMPLLMALLVALELGLAATESLCLHPDTSPHVPLGRAWLGCVALPPVRRYAHIPDVDGSIGLVVPPSVRPSQAAELCLHTLSLSQRLVSLVS